MVLKVRSTYISILFDITITDMLGQESLAPKFLIEGVISFPQIWLSVAKCSNKKEQKKVVQEAFKIFLSFTGAFRTQSSN